MQRRPVSRGEHFHVIVAEDDAPLQLAYRRFLPPDMSRDLLSGPSQGCTFVRFENERIELHGLDADETPTGRSDVTQASFALAHIL